MPLCITSSVQTGNFFVITFLINLCLNFEYAASISNINNIERTSKCKSLTFHGAQFEYGGVVEQVFSFIQFAVKESIHRKTKTALLLSRRAVAVLMELRQKKVIGSSLTTAIKSAQSVVCMRLYVLNYKTNKRGM